MKKINILLVVLMLAGTLWYMLFRYESDRLLTYLAVPLVLAAPFLLWGTKFRLNATELCFYYSFMFLADYLGCVVNLYEKISWYDTAVHFGSGIFCFVVAIWFLGKVGVTGLNFWITVLFGMGIVSMVALVWEGFEFGCDNLLGFNLQHNIDTGVLDTMVDMLSAFGGGLLAALVYFFL